LHADDGLAHDTSDNYEGTPASDVCDVLLSFGIAAARFISQPEWLRE